MNEKSTYTTMRGNKIDVDLIKLKSGISRKEKESGVVKREQFINDKRKRISRKRMTEMLNNQIEVANRLNTKQNNNFVSEDLTVPVVSNETVDEKQDIKKIRKKK